MLSWMWGTARSAVNRAERLGSSHLPMIKALKEVIEKTVLKNHRKAWQNQNDCVIAQTLWPEIDMDRTKPLMEHKNNSVRVTTGVITGNCAMGSTPGLK